MLRVRLILLFLLLGLGFWQVGEGAWMTAKAQLAQYLLQRAWQRTMQGQDMAKPWPWADTWPLAKLQVPKYGVDLIVLAGASGRTLAFGPAHASATAVPGKTGTAVLSGHRDTHFRFLERLQLGDEILVEVPEEGTSRYQVVEITIVNARHARIEALNDRQSLVLITCYPFDAILPGGPLRYIVIAERHASF
jgi:sortase A